MAILKFISTGVLVVSFLVFISGTSEAAETYQGIGAARIINNDTAKARETALKSAIFDASTKQGGNLFGYTATKSGKITTDTAILYSTAKLVNYSVLEETTDDNLVKIAVTATFSKNFKKLVCNKNKTRSVIDIYFPTVKYRNMSSEEKFFIADNLARSFNRFASISRDKPKSQNAHINFKQATKTPRRAPESYDSYLYDAAGTKNGETNEINFIFEFDRIDKTFYRTYQLTYSIEFKGRQLDSNHAPSGSIEFPREIDLPSKTINVLASSLLQSKQLNIPFEKLLDLKKLIKSKNPKCEILRSKLVSSPRGYYVKLGFRHGISKHDLGWFTPDGVTDEILLIEKVEANRTFFKTSEANDIEKYSSPIITMVRYE